MNARSSQAELQTFIEALERKPAEVIEAARLPSLARPDPTTFEEKRERWREDVVDRIDADLRASERLSKRQHRLELERDRLRRKLTSVLEELKELRRHGSR
jgi:predicted ribosome quality control (RQC) complex YloA/Tae2 family protein